MRFARDKRGYETTSLVHAERRQGRSRQRILYWFRTPPGVKVGRPALDEAAIRWIEEHNPDIEFDWQKILEAKPLPAPPSDDQRLRRGRRDRPERSRAARPQPSAPQVAPVPAVAQPEPVTLVPENPPHVEDPMVSDDELEEVIVQLAQSDEEPQGGLAASPVEHAVGREDLTRLRARYAELLARIAERGGDVERIEALRTQADVLNPDTWVTGEDVRKGLAEFDPKLRDLRAALGLRQRRRSRRGGRRRSSVRPENAPAPEPEPEKGEG